MIPLIGREPELELLRGELRRMAGGELRVILIAGEAGVGKSRLMAEAISHSNSTDLALTARSYLLGATASFGPWLEALDRHARGSGGGSLQVGPNARHREAADRESLLEVLVSSLGRLGEAGSVVVALDDMDLADASSWEALRFVSRRLFGRPISIMLTVRPGRLAAIPLALDVLVSLEEDGVLRRLNLRPLDRAEISRLAIATLRESGSGGSGDVPEALIDWLMERSRGHPLFANVLLEALIEEEADLARPELHGAPERLVARIRRELPRLAPPARQVLEVLAVMDHRATPHHIAAALGSDLPSVAHPLETLCTSSLVVENRGPSELSYEIVHPLIQEAIYQTIVGARRLTLHRAIARVLLGEGSWGSAVGHFARSVSVADDEVFSALCDAMRRAGSRGLYREKLAILRVVMDVLPQADPRWRDVLVAIAPHSSWVTDHLAEHDAELAIEVMRRVEEVYGPDGDAGERGLVQLYLAALLAIGAGRMGEARQACLRALALFEDVEDRRRVLLARNELVWIESCAGNLDRAIALADEVLEEVDHGDEPVVEIQAAGARAYALVLQGRFDEADEDYDRADRGARATSNRYRRVWGMVQRSQRSLLAGDLDGALRLLETAFDMDHGLACAALGLERLAHCRWMAGKLKDCIRAVEESEARRMTKGSRRRAWGLAVAARAHAEAGRARRARLLLARAQETYGDSEILDWSAWCNWTAGFLAHTERDFDEAVYHYLRAAESYRGMGALAPEAFVLIDIAEVALDAADASLLEDITGRLEELASRVGGQLVSALVSLARSMDGLVRGSPDPTAGEAALRAFDESGYGLLATTAGLVLGRSGGAHAEAGAIDVLRQAAERSDEFGAEWRRDRILAALRERGAKGRRVVDAVRGPSSLTNRERQVAELAAGGHTAHEIARRLFIGTRTVESHLARIYPKLGVRSKRELVTRAGELGLTDENP